MKKTVLFVLACLCLAATQALARDFVLTDTTGNVSIPEWTVSAKSLGFTDGPAFSVTKTTLHGGKQEGSTRITIVTPELEVSLIPTRGMDIYEIKSGGIRFGWKSPVDEIVNPAFMNLEMRGGLGWLDGFNEMMVRCGYEWTGHPGQEQGRLMSLHGRAGNTPASKVVVAIDDKAPHAIHVKGLIKENTFKFAALETWTELTVTPGVKCVKIHDVLTNNSDYDRDYQIIYHSNFGVPILEAGAKVLIPVQEISPFNDYAKKGLADWQTYLGPTKGYDEMVFNIRAYAGKDGWTPVVLRNKAGDHGIAVRYDAAELPVLTLWKNTDTLRQGYVTGIEPGTSYAYPRQIERKQGRVKSLAPGASQAFDVEYWPLTTGDEVAGFAKRVEAVAAGRTPKVVAVPMAKE
ncbi:conserved hypothetical protein [Solidesulfovibrio fructosivorans JJ]]|uniref:DUF4432 domain-containing protein n=1 Tax=Solidesulfovibrio fructosivorans JJ] TaxID=596151 RepID=E1JSY6_SOLFR|nr:aldose 1-epimerase family protein [Solidesulfovibrio fructosivorans]EFL52619.1 conserved hypothetical protein [Solidesulfovibrio fructosivorans JJ]]